MDIKWLTPTMLFLLAGCQSFQTPVYNICEAKPNQYPANYTFIPEKIDSLIKIAPNYPSWAEDEKLEGFVKLSYAVVSGKVVDIKVLESFPQDTFDKAAIAALKRWRYRQTYKNCVPYPQRYQMETKMDFNL